MNRMSILDTNILEIYRNRYKSIEIYYKTTYNRNKSELKSNTMQNKIKIFVIKKNI